MIKKKNMYFTTGTNQIHTCTIHLKRSYQKENKKFTISKLHNYFADKQIVCLQYNRIYINSFLGICFCLTVRYEVL